MHYSLLFLIAATCSAMVESARILAIMGTDLNSHFKVFTGVIENIASHHQITYYVDEVFKYKPPPNVETRTFRAPSRTGSLNMTELFQNPCKIDSYDVYYNHILITNETYFDSVLSSTATSHLFNLNETYDLLMINGYGSEHFFRLAHTLNIPFVQVTPSLLMPWNNEAINNPYSLVNDFSFAVPGEAETFLGRLEKFVKSILINYRFYGDHISVMEHITKKYFPPGTPSIKDAYKKTDLIFVNTHNVMGYTRPNIQTAVEIGGLHIKPPKTLPRDLKQFISGSGQHGFIYFSLGSFVKESELPKYILKSIINVFRKLPQRVLWKWSEQMNDLPANVKILKWMPQGDILAHKKIKLFMSQGGMLSIQEAVYHGVPVLIFPVIFDQYNNAFLAEKKGYGKSISFCDFTEKKFEKIIKDLLSNSTYSQNVKQMSTVMKQQNADLTQRVNWWINFVINHNGTTVLKPLISYYNWTDMPVDLLSFFAFMLSCLTCILFYCFMHIIRHVSITGKRKIE